MTRTGSMVMAINATPMADYAFAGQAERGRPAAVVDRQKPGNAARRAPPVNMPRKCRRRSPPTGAPAS
jgi:hypothetical protein